jgi:hypothetical protein
VLYDAGLSQGSVGVILLILLSMTSRVKVGMQMSTLVENMMTFVERILEYGRLDVDIKIKSDKVLSITDSDKVGEIQFRNV